MKQFSFRVGLLLPDNTPSRWAANEVRYAIENRNGLFPERVTVTAIPKEQPDSMKLPEKPKLRLFADDKLFLFYVAATEADAQRMYFDETNCTDVLVEIDLTKPGSY